MTYLPTHFPIDPPIQIANSGSYGISTGGTSGNTTPIYTDRVGRWMFYTSITGNLSTNEDNPNFNIAVRLNGGNVSAPSKSLHAYSGNDMNWGRAQTIEDAIRNMQRNGKATAYVVSGSITVYQYLFFVPTLAHPR